MNYVSRYCVPFSLIVFCVTLFALLYTPSTLSIFETKRAQAAESIPSIIYGGPGFTEASDGSVTGSITATLFEDTFQDTDLDNILDIGTEVTVNNIPAGLTPVVTLGSSPTSTEPTAWTSASAAEVSGWRSVTYGNAIFVAVSYIDTNQVMYSTDGITWTLASAATQSSWSSVTYGNGRFVAVADSGSARAMYSNDGIIWTAATGTPPSGWTSVTYGNGRFVAVARSGSARAMYSNDGITWTAGAAISGTDWTSVTYGNGKFVAVGDDGTNRVMYSNDGITWTGASSTEQNGWSSVTYGTGRFVAVAYVGINQVMYSNDGISWTAASSTEQNSWSTVTYGNGKFVAIANSGTNLVMYSTDGINWTAAPASESSNWTSVTYGKGKFVAVAYFGTNQVMYSSGAASDKIATLTLTGNATAHENINDVSNITFSFADSAFISATSAASILNATGPASSGRGIDFADAVVVAPPSSGGGGGGGGGGSPRYCNDPKANNYKPAGKGKAAVSACQYDTKTTAPISTPTPESLETNKVRLALLSQIAQLQALLAKLQIGSGGTVPAGTGSSSALCVYTRNLTLQMIGEDVKCLQKYLNKKGFIISATGTGAPGFESTYFGKATLDALKRFQNANAASVLYPAGLTEGTGYFGTITRDFVSKDR